ncbi:MAG: squalene synthase HpnC [Burkholderiales bacterium]
MPVAHYENFPVASLLVPARLRTPIEAIYRFARDADDVADEGDDLPAVRLAKLEAKRGEIERISGEHGLPRAPFADLLDAFSQDVVKTRYASYVELLDYCRRSANPVGRLLLHLFKRTSETQLHQSDAICTSLQQINFWQDVAVDYAKGRVYLPQDEMARCGVAETNLAEGRCDNAWRTLLAFQVERTRALMLSGAPLGRSLPGRIGLEIRATVQGGLRILEKIEGAGYDVFRRRPVLRALDWPMLLARAL